MTANPQRAAPDVALQYKQLWMVEDIFRPMKSLLETRPLHHKCDETVRVHVFGPFLALVPRKKMQDRVERKEWGLKQAGIIRDLDRLQEVEMRIEGKRVVIRTETKGTARIPSEPGSSVRIP